MKTLLLALGLVFLVSCNGKDSPATPTPIDPTSDAPVEYSLNFFYDLDIGSDNIHLINLNENPLMQNTALHYSVNGFQCASTIVLQKTFTINTYHIQFVTVGPVDQYQVGSAEACDIFKTKTYWLDLTSDDSLNMRRAN